MDDGISGTALLVQDQLRHNYSLFSRDELKQQTWQVAMSPDSSLSSKITAVQLMGSLKDTSAANLSINIAQNTSLDPTLRMVALGTLGVIGNAGHLSVIENFKNEEDQRLRNAANRAIERLSKKI